jgi:hypothetical protein
MVAVCRVHLDILAQMASILCLQINTTTMGGIMGSPFRMGIGPDAMGAPGGMGRNVTRGTAEDDYHEI